MKHKYLSAYLFQRMTCVFILACAFGILLPSVPCLAVDDNQTDKEADQGMTMTLEADQLKDMSDNDKAKGVVIALNNDRDNFDKFNSNTYDADSVKTTIVEGEDDLQEITIGVHYKDITARNEAIKKKQIIKLELTGENGAALKVWLTKDKSRLDNQPVDKQNPLLLSAGTQMFYEWPVETVVPENTNNINFDQAIFVEGVNGTDINKAQLKLTYLERTPERDIVADGNEIIIPFSVIGITMDNYYDYRPTPNNQVTLKLSKIDASIVDSVTMAVPDKKDGTGKDVTRLRGIAMNRNLRPEFYEEEQLPVDEGPDFLFQNETLQQDVNVPIAGNVQATAEAKLISHDHAGRCRIVAEVKRGNVILCKPEISIPLDRDGDWLPNKWEDENQFDRNNSGDTLYDGETQAKVRPLVWNTINPDNPGEFLPPFEDFAAYGDPPQGILGDGLTAWEEYRGFYVYLDGNHDNEWISTSPHKKNVFVHSDVLNIDETFVGIGNLTAVAPQLELNTISEKQWNGMHNREINFNRYDGEDPIKVSANGGIENIEILKQCAVYVTSQYIGEPGAPGSKVEIGNPTVGYTRGGVTTGPNGICETDAMGDFAIIHVGNGLANTTAILPGPNGIIDPFYDPQDQLKYSIDLGQWIIDMPATGEQYLHTLDGQYWPPQAAPAPGQTPLHDDVVEGHIYGGTLRLAKKTLANMKTTATVDPITNQPRVPNGDDIYNADTQTISPGLNGTLESVPFQNDTVLQNIIHAGFKLSDETLANMKTTATVDPITNQPRVPNGDDIYNVDTQTISPGLNETDTLESRNYNGDKVNGRILGGANSLLSPLLNDTHKFLTPFTTPERPGIANGDNDDKWDKLLNVIKTGANGVCNTSRMIHGDDVQVIFPGRGLPYALCIDTDNRDDHFDAEEDAKVNSSIVLDDTPLRPVDANVDVNNTAAGYIDVNNLYRPDRTYIGDFQATLVDHLPRWATARRAQDHFLINEQTTPEELEQIKEKFRALLYSLIAHEGGHMMHLDHWEIQYGAFVDLGEVSEPYYLVKFILGSGEPITDITPKKNDPLTWHLPYRPSIMTTPLGLPPASSYDDADRVQFRLHTKHE